MKNISSAAFSDTKPHYELLDGLRGVAALLVVFYHIFDITVKDGTDPIQSKYFHVLIFTEPI